MPNKTAPIIVPVKNGWHAGSVPLNITVWGATPEEARAHFERAVQKASELRAKAADWGRTSADLGRRLPTSTARAGAIRVLRFARPS